MNIYIAFSFLVLSFCNVNAQLDSLSVNQIELQKSTQVYQMYDGTVRTYTRPKFWEMVTRIPRDFIDTNKDFVAKDHAWYLAGSVGSTVVLLPIDQQVIDQSRAWAQKNGLSEANLYGKFGPLTNIPQNIGAGFYLIGNGTTVILLSAGFVAYGLIKDDYRAKATASGLMESLAVSGVFVQAVKLMTGRESPFIAIENGNPGGKWTPFPSFSAYAKQTPSYDAMPSGHLTTIMAGLTVITTNYPEYKWIKPIGYTLIAGLGYQMIQSEVHWVSDYPLALFIGYFVGKTIAKNRFKETIKDVSFINKKYKIDYLASRSNGFNTLGVLVKF